MFEKIPLFVKIILVIIFPFPALVLWVVFKFIKPMIVFGAKENKAFSDLVNNPTEENAREYIELMKTKPMATFAPENNPNAWAVMREKWQIINHSNKIPTDMKKEILDILTQKGLYVNSHIVNNFKK